ncbi:unnamed protein product [Echinostoma caproni]|uniref:Growth inhibitor PemK n=1 Tax=Echinostoma caproni TaxID=27848 RepID=A0A183A0B4_9TREM|nr:unnamed protein product [Echinostoma caproni]
MALLNTTSALTLMQHVMVPTVIRNDVVGIRTGVPLGKSNPSPMFLKFHRAETPKPKTEIRRLHNINIDDLVNGAEELCWDNLNSI